MKSDRMQAVLCSLLSDAIRGRPARDIPPFSPGEWNRLMEAALRRGILALLYPAAAGLPAGTIPADRLTRWRHLALQAGIGEARRFHLALEATDAFAKRALPCVAFKGMVLRALYPQPDLRTMGDIDLLLRPADLPAAEDLLRKQGHRPVGVNTLHHTWRAGPGLLIELHTALLPRSPGTLEDAFFAGATPHRADNRVYSSPSPEDAAFYQVLHMAKHFRYLGFGLRELADFTLQVEKGLSLPRLLERLDAAGVGKFGRAVLLAARNRLALKLPDETAAAWNIPAETVDRLGDDILNAGIHGGDNLGNALSLAAIRQDGTESGSRARWRLLLWLLFPPAGDLLPRYAYARSRRWLLPLAWVHRLARTAVLSPAAACTVLGFALRHLVAGNPRQRFQADLGLLQP